MSATNTPLHPTQERLLNVLKENVGDPMSIRDLQVTLDLSSPSLVQHHMQQLEVKGYLRRNPSNPRDYQVLSESPDKKIAFINVYGLAECGPNGSLLDGDPVDNIAIGSRLLGFSSTEAFAVKARGASMAPYIKSGDIVIARKTTDQNNGDLVVCVNDEMTLIKRIRIKDKQVYLISLNPEHLPFPAAEDFRVEGVVKRIITNAA